LSSRMKRRISIGTCPLAYFSGIEGRSDQYVCFFVFPLQGNSCCQLFITIRTKQRSIVFGKVNRTFNNPINIHSQQSPFPHFLILDNVGFTISTRYQYYMATPRFFIIRIFIDQITILSLKPPF